MTINIQIYYAIRHHIMTNITTKRWVLAALGMMLAIVGCAKPASIRRSSLKQATIDQQFIEPNAPIVVALNGLEHIMKHIEHITKSLVVNTALEGNITQALVKRNTESALAFLTTKGLNPSKRMLAWLSHNTRFLEIALPVNDAAGFQLIADQIAKLFYSQRLSLRQRRFVQQLEQSDEPKTIEETFGPAPHLDSNKIVSKNGDMFWHDKELSSSKTRMACHHTEGYARCSIDMLGEGISTEAYTAHWITKEAPPIRFTRNVDAGIQLWTDVRAADTQKKIRATLTNLGKLSPRIVTSIFDYVQDDEWGELWVDITQDAIRFGVRDTGDGKLSPLKPTDLSGMPKSAVAIVAGFSMNEAGLMAIMRKQDGFMGLISQSSTPLNELRKLFLKRSKRKKDLALMELTGGRPYYGFIDINKVARPAKDAKASDNFFSRARQLCRTGFVQQLANDVSNDVLNRILTMKPEDLPLDPKQWHSNEMNEIAQNAQAPEVKRNPDIDSENGISAKWDYIYSSTSGKERRMSMWRKDNRTLYGFGGDVSNVLTLKDDDHLSEPEAALHLKQCTELDTFKWAPSSSGCRMYAAFRDIESIVKTSKHVLPPRFSAFADIATPIVSRIKALTIGVTNSGQQEFMVGRLQFQFNSSDIQ